MKPLVPLISFLLLVATGLCFRTDHTATKAQKKITLFFHHRIGNTELTLGDTVKNILGDNIVIERFRYYVSNFSITDNKGNTTKLPVEYFLVDEENAPSKQIELMIPDQPVSQINFILGVDSIRNVSGIQTGALDPLKGMFWTWNSGYIMAKLEGSAETVASSGHRFTYHIGGFKKNQNVVKKISLNLPESTSAFQELHLSADINHWFKGTSELKIAETPVCHSPGALAMRIADNYSTMFSINTAR
jgi:hypothetical protein